MQEKSLYDTDWLKVDSLCKLNKGSISITDFNFTIAPLEKLAIIGETGSGKTTLLKLIAGLEHPDSGTINFEGDIVKSPLKQLIAGHPGIAYLSQHYELRHNYYVHEILEYANQLTLEEAEKLYAICEIQHLLNRRTNELSGGESQRIALARLLSTSPKLLLLDEPFSNLDNTHKKTIKSVIENISAELNITCLMVSHFAEDVLSWADKVIVIKAGNMVQQGNPQQVYYHPINEYCAGLLGNYNFLNANLFTKLKLNSQNKNGIIRPEKIKIIPESNGIRGIVTNCSFYGNHFVLDVLVEEENLQIISNIPYQKNQSIEFEINEEDVHYFDLD